MSRQEKHLYEFGPFRLDPGDQLLLRGGNRVPLTPKAFETLVLLVRRSGRLVEKDELFKELWPDSFAEMFTLRYAHWAPRAYLSVNISALRKALGAQ